MHACWVTGCGGGEVGHAPEHDARASCCHRPDRFKLLPTSLFLCRYRVYGEKEGEG